MTQHVHIYQKITFNNEIAKPLPTLKVLEFPDQKPKKSIEELDDFESFHYNFPHPDWMESIGEQIGNRPPQNTRDVQSYRTSPAVIGDRIDELVEKYGKAALEIHFVQPDCLENFVDVKRGARITYLPAPKDVQETVNARLAKY